jgi:mannose-1-phosphate guanylyltransferase
MRQSKDSLKHTKTVQNRAAIVLAGGDGSRLSSLTKLISGSEIPKQFCPVVSNRTMLEETLERTKALVPIEHTVVVVNRAHRPSYQPLLTDLTTRQTVEQPSNRGTAPAMLYGLRRLLELGSDAIVAVFPSDHFIGNSEQFIRQLENAFRTIGEFPQLCLLLGIAPSEPETSFGWVEPGAKIPSDRSDIHLVRRFWEKPSQQHATRLYHSGCLWNSFILVAALPVLYSMLAEYAQELFCTFNAEMVGTTPDNEASAADQLYRRLDSTGFSEQVLSQCPPNLAVFRMDNIDWNDLGEPARVLEVVAALKRPPRWFEDFHRNQQCNLTLF